MAPAVAGMPPPRPAASLTGQPDSAQPDERVRSAALREPLPSRALLSAPRALAAAVQSVASAIVPSTAKKGPKRDRSAIAARIQALGLSDRLHEAPPGWLEGAPAAEVEAGAVLLSALRQQAAAAGVSDDRLWTALNWLDSFKAVFPNRILFLPLGGANHYANAVHNEETFGMIFEFIRVSGSKKGAGKAVTSKVISGYISAIRTQASLGAGYRLYDERFAVELPRNAKYHRRVDGPAAVRKLRRGVRAQHFAAAARAGFDRFTAPGIRRWARALTSHNLMLRGGEPGVVEGNEWRADAGHMSWASVTWLAAAAYAKVGWRAMVEWLVSAASNSEARYPAVRIFVQPIKDGDATLRPVPLLIRRRQRACVPIGNDPLCTFDALLTLFMLDADVLPPDHWHHTPLFSESAGGNAVDTAVVREDARAIAKSAGLDVSEVGSTSFRIGGAEDHYDVLGPGSENVIRERGRWHSDIHEIYQRCSATAHLSLSAALGDATGISLEALGDGWAQPGR